jgi:hypothetical protein
MKAAPNVEFLVIPATPKLVSPMTVNTIALTSAMLKPYQAA